MLLGKRLPPYGQNAERAKAWGMACMRPSERSLSHDIAQERAVKVAAAAAQQGDFPWARECRCSMRCASSSDVSTRSWDKQSRRIELVDCWSWSVSG